MSSSRVRPERDVLVEKTAGVPSSLSEQKPSQLNNHDAKVQYLQVYRCHMKIVLFSFITVGTVLVFKGTVQRDGSGRN